MRLATLRFSGALFHRRGRSISGLVLIAAAFELAAATGLSYVAGFSTVLAALGLFDWPYLLLTAAAVAFSFVGYYFAYRGVFGVGQGATLDARQMLAVVAAGFGGFLAHGGSALDRFALEGVGADKREAKVRVVALGGFEHGVLALVGTAAAIALLALHASKPPANMLVPWAVIPVPAFALAFWAVGRPGVRARSAGLAGVAVLVDAVALIRRMFLAPRQSGVHVIGMAAFFIFDAFGLWAAVASFGYLMFPAAVYIGMATGLVFTRRTGPFGGAGILMLLLPLALWLSGAPLATAIVGVFVVRMIGLWIPLPLSLLSLETLRELAPHHRLHTPPAGGTVGTVRPEEREGP